MSRKGSRVVSTLILVAAFVAGIVPQGTGQVLAAVYAAGDSVVVDADSLNLRAGAGLSYDVIEVLKGGTELTVTGGPQSADDYIWYRVSTDDGTTGWVADAYLAFARSWARFAVGDPAIVDASRLNCRSGPGLEFDVRYVLTRSTEVDILDGPTTADGYHWYKVRDFEERVGWVVGEALIPGVDSPAGVFAKGDEVAVATDALNLRRGAGLTYEVIDVLQGGTWLLVSNGPTSADGHDWYEVETRYGQLGWVTGRYLGPASGRGFTVGDAVRVTGGRLNLRAEPDLSATVLRVMADNEVLLVLDGPAEADGYSWYEVRNYAGTGWAAGEYLRFDPDGFPSEDGA